MSCNNINNQWSDPWLMRDITEDNNTDTNETDLKFGDNFEPQLNANQTNASNVDLLPDSQQYIKSLERKLDKLKGKTKETSAKDVVNSLAMKRDALLQQFLQSSVGPEDHFDDQMHDSNVANNSLLYTYVERRLFPHSQAITAEELIKLLEADLLEKYNSANRENK